MEETTFEKIGVNTAFMLRKTEEPDKDVWCSKIDDSRYIRIGQSGSYHVEDGDALFIEAL